MAPIRRYLRITKYSVIECRIYLDNPALAHTWLLNPRKPILPRVIESVRPLVLPKLREERERSRKRSTKKKGIKDVVVEDDFEVSIFLTETTTRHSLLTKHKHFHDTTQTKLVSNSGRLVGATSEAPIDVDIASADLTVELLREEGSDDEDMGATLAAIPAADDSAAAEGEVRRSKRARRDTGAEIILSDDEEADPESEDEEEDQLFVSSPGPDETESMGPPPAKRRKDGATIGIGGMDDDEDEKKKKLAMDISYEGFSIYGRVLCLVVKRRDGGSGRSTGSGSGTGAKQSGKTSAGANRSAAGGSTGQNMMETFIVSTQIPPGAELEP